jgi:phage recombination protein Bet
MSDLVIALCDEAIASNKKQQQKYDLIACTFCKDSSRDEIEMFLAICNRTGLDPFNRQIFAVKRWDARSNREIMQIQVSIDGFRLIAQRSGEYEGQTLPQWCGLDGVWKDVWLADQPPHACRIGVYRKGFREACFAIAIWREYCQSKKDGTPNAMWAKMPALMLSKCAEALALRKSFAAELSGLYAPEEMAQASEPAPEQKQITATPSPRPSPPSPLKVEPVKDDHQFIEVSPKATVTVVTNAKGTPVWRIDQEGQKTLAIFDPTIASAIEANQAFSLETRCIVEKHGTKLVVVGITEEQEGDS